jgi:acetyltransferase-like isoleucine patch superfamily enzyme
VTSDVSTLASPMERRRPDPLSYLQRIAKKFHTTWLRMTYPFISIGHGASVECSAEISRQAAQHVYIGNDVFIGKDVWLNVMPEGPESAAKISLGRGCRIGRRTTISARNSIFLEENVLLAPSVLLMDHNHEYSNPDIPIHAQGITAGGKIVVGKNCWLGYGCVIFCASGELSIGQNSVVGANAVVTKSIPPFSVVAGSPARVVKQYDAASGEWVRV